MRIRTLVLQPNAEMSTLMQLLIKMLFVLNLHTSWQCPIEPGIEDMKAAYKAGEAREPPSPITLDKIKEKLKESGIFDQDQVELNDMERKELKKLFDTVEIMTTSRNRQPQSVQNLFSFLRMMERVVKKQLKENQISETLAAKFHWEKLSGRQRRENPVYYVNKNNNMRMFYYS